MMKFAAGTRVIYKRDGHKGTVEGTAPSGAVHVKWDGTDMTAPSGYMANELALLLSPADRRKVIQVVSSIDSVGKYFILAVCDDGTLWQLDNLYRESGKDPNWVPFPTPPQS